MEKKAKMEMFKCRAMIQDGVGHLPIEALHCSSRHLCVLDSESRLYDEAVARSDESLPLVH